ncbi:VOC family protein [Paenibacillus pinisoli]|uniref:VOC family protein n=1 Tax=Paenibacillus pinisoli TaxID=1276110 RepID=A0A3A6PEM5_9BACL|nr:VOC family protein [Paenibacillus pinisoli]RJX39165.1 VOC family protein [Paenibacillus pinisoli]
MGKLKPYIISENARTQGQFYIDALGGRLMSAMTHEEAMGAQHDDKDKVMHMCIEVAGENYIFLADGMEPFTHGSGLYLSLELDSESQAREAFEKLSDGGQVKYPFEFQPFGLYLGEVKDKYGVWWMITAQGEAN